MEDIKRNILIAGSGAPADALAKKLSQSPMCGMIYVTSPDSAGSKLYKTVDIREDDITGLLKFAIDNEISLTIPVSETGLKSDIVPFFQNNGQNIFGSSKEACKIAINKAYGKKFLYKLHALTSKFGIFDKAASAVEWLKTAKFPVMIRSREAGSHGDRLVCPTMSLADEFLSSLFSKGETEVLAEEFISGHNFTIYYITDSYSAVPVTAVGNYKFAQDGGAGFWTNGTGCYAPDYKISETVFARLQNIVNNTLKTLEKKNQPYMGFLGVDCTLLDDDKFVINEFKPFLQDFDAQAVLNLIEDDLIRVIFACIEGYFADDYEHIPSNSLSSVSAVVTSRQHNKVIKGLDKIDNPDDINLISVKNSADGKILTTKGGVFVLTRTAANLTRAKEYLYEDLEQIKFDGMRYRTDICK